MSRDVRYVAHFLLTKSDDPNKTRRTRPEDFIFVSSRVEIRKFHAIWGLGVTCEQQQTIASKKKTSVDTTEASTAHAPRTAPERLLGQAGRLVYCGNP